MQNIFIFWPEVVTTFIISYFLTGYVRKISLEKKWVQPVRDRDVHRQPTSRFGGVAVFGSFWLVILIIALTASTRLDFNSGEILSIDKKLLGVFLGGLIIFLVGIFDDKKNIHWSIKLLAQTVSALIVVYFGIGVTFLSNPFGGGIELGIFGPLFVVLWMVVLMNAINWLDGLDGLATGIGAIASLILGMLAMSSIVNQSATGLLAFVFLGALLGFLPWNISPAKIFLGDNGSLFLGYFIAVLAVISGGKVATAGLVLGLPLLDFLWVVMRRIMGGHSPFLADKLHLHHRLLEAGFSTKQAVLFLYIISIIFGIIALNTQTYEKFLSAIILILVIFVLGLLLVYRPKLRRVNHAGKR